jgi:hypothetical protein
MLAFSFRTTMGSATVAPAFPSDTIRELDKIIFAGAAL